MDSLKINEDVCRICLKENINLNWNNEMIGCNGIRYKDCYYKYTQLQEPDSDCFPTSLCQMCAIGLESAYMLFEKALESFNFLHSVMKTKQFEAKHDIPAFDTTQLNIEDDLCFSPTFNHETIAETKNELSDFEEELVEEVVTVEPMHFVDIQQIEPSAEILLQDDLSEISNSELNQQLNEPYNTKLSKSLTYKKAIKRNKRCASLTISSLEKQHIECYDDKLPSQYPIRATVKKRNKRVSFQQNRTECSETKSALPATKTTKAKDRIFMCMYCSLKIKGGSNLAKHEATHNKNRKRTETCPQCGIKLYTKLTLTEHMKTHDEKRQKNHKCEFCEKAFFNKGGLNVHRRIHLGLMVKCQLCTKEFFRQIDLDKHLLKHSASPLQRNVKQNKYIVQCQYCNKSIVTSRWKEHLGTHLDKPIMKCKLCDKNFCNRRYCIRHLQRVHRKSLSEYENCIHYYDDRRTRISTLIMKQQMNAVPRTENLQHTEVQ